jgi:hypothetical protein
LPWRWRHEEAASYSKTVGKDVQDHLLPVKLSSREDKDMPYSPKHKRDTREKILESARRLFNRDGYSGVSIGEIMTDAGLTHGGFYRHFSAKDELYAAAVRQFLCKKAPSPWQKQREPTRVTRSVDKGLWTPISRDNTSTITKAAARCSGRPPKLNAAGRS